MHESLKNIEMVNWFESKDPTPLSFQNRNLYPWNERAPSLGQTIHGMKEGMNRELPFVSHCKKTY